MKPIIDLTTRGKLPAGYGLIPFPRRCSRLLILESPLCNHRRPAFTVKISPVPWPFMALEGGQDEIRDALMTMILLPGDDDWTKEK